MAHIVRCGPISFQNNILLMIYSEKESNASESPSWLMIKFQSATDLAKLISIIYLKRKKSIGSGVWCLYTTLNFK